MTERLNVKKNPTDGAFEGLLAGLETNFVIFLEFTIAFSRGPYFYDIALYQI